MISAKKADMIRAAFLEEANKPLREQLAGIRLKQAILESLPRAFTLFKLDSFDAGPEFGELWLSCATTEQALKAFDSAETLPMCLIGPPSHGPKLIPVCRTEQELKHLSNVRGSCGKAPVAPAIRLEGSCVMRTVAGASKEYRCPKVIGYMMLEGSVIMIGIRVDLSSVRLGPFLGENTKAKYKTAALRKAWPDIFLLHAAYIGNVCVLCRKVKNSKWKEPDHVEQ